MAYITREDGEHFVIPSYRDVLNAKNKGALKREVLQLSQSYGEYITMQKRGLDQYEVAFSPDTGYLLGESIWHRLKRPLDMIYCEALPNSAEAILVIVKEGSVYLDGSFPIDSIPEELVIFLTQENNFEIYVSGDVPISEQPEAGHFSFEPGSVKSFTVLEKPIFPTLPLVPIYQLRLVHQVLKANRIGVFPTKQVVMVFLFLAVAWMLWSYLTRPTQVQVQLAQNPYQQFEDRLVTAGIDQQVNQLLTALQPLTSMPGWSPKSFIYENKNLTVVVTSQGGSMQSLFDWAKLNNFKTDIQTTGISIQKSVDSKDRTVPTKIFTVKDTIARIIDNLGQVYPGNRLSIGNFVNNGTYTTVDAQLTVQDVSPALLQLITAQFAGLPCVLKNITMDVANGSFSGTISFDVLGN